MITENHKCCKTAMNRLHWTAIFAGAFVGVGLGFLLNMFSTAIGLSAYTAPSNGATVIAIGGVLGLLIGVIASMGVSGFVAGYLGRYSHCYCHGGVIYGFITWSLALILSALLIMPMTHYVSFYEENIDPNLAPLQVSKADVNVSTTSEPNVPAPKMMGADPQQLVWNSWILFGVFFLGAFSSCVGACYGMRCKMEEEQNITSTL